MLPFKVEFEPGISAYRQVVYAAKKSVVRGQLCPGEKFPSVRALSQALKINPNTAHKVVAQLVGEGLLQVRPGIGTVVAKVPPASATERAALLEDDLERVLVEAKRLSLGLEEIFEALEQHWRRLSAGTDESRRLRGESVKERL